jgi:cold shock protein
MLMILNMAAPRCPGTGDQSSRSFQVDCVGGLKWLLRKSRTAALIAHEIKARRVHAGGALSFAGFLSPSYGVLDSMRRVDVATGIVKWFNSTKGYGFIQPDGGGKDVFVHISAVEKAGFSSLAEGAKVSYEIVSDRGKESAGNLRL